jgi:hypothetical protein
MLCNTIQHTASSRNGRVVESTSVKLTKAGCGESNHLGERALHPLLQLQTRVSFGGKMSIGTILLIILVIALLGGFSGLGGGPFYGTGYYGGGGIGLILVIVVILVVLGKL